MSPVDLLDILGAAAMFALAAVLAYIGSRHHAYDRYGQEALWAGAAALTTIGTCRVLIVADAIDSPTARIVNTLAVTAYLAVLAQAIYMKHHTRPVKQRRNHR